MTETTCVFKKNKAGRPRNDEPCVTCQKTYSEHQKVVKAPRKPRAPKVQDLEPHCG